MALDGRPFRIHSERNYNRASMLRLVNDQGIDEVGLAPGLINNLMPQLHNQPPQPDVAGIVLQQRTPG